jgi:SAM-dependent methyltransferase
VQTLVSTALGRSRRALTKSPVGLALFRLRNRSKEAFVCPICFYRGPLRDVFPETGPRRHAACPRCGALERHRLQYLVLESMRQRHQFSRRSILHFAPEPFFRDYFRRVFGRYSSADLRAGVAEHQADLRALPFPDASYDFVFASHVLEHIEEDGQALSEIARVLAPGGIAVLPVPIVAPRTIEYPEPNPHEEGHVRAPGPDYFARYLIHFRAVEQLSSHDFPARFQPFVYESRDLPTPTSPLRPSVPGERHADIVPVCFK